MGVREQLLSAIADSGLSLYRIAEDTETDYGSLHKFVHRDRDIRLSTVNQLTSYFQMRLTRPIRPKQTGGA